MRGTIPLAAGAAAAGAATGGGAAAVAAGIPSFTRGTGGHLAPPTCVNGTYRVGRKIGSGSFGCLYEGVDPRGREVAIKLEPANTKHPQLLYEARIVKLLQGGSEAFIFARAGSYMAFQAPYFTRRCFYAVAPCSRYCAFLSYFCSRSPKFACPTGELWHRRVLEARAFSVLEM